MPAIPGRSPLEAALHLLLGCVALLVHSSQMNTSHAVLKTVYREHPPNISTLAETNTGDEVGGMCLDFLA